MWIVGGDANQGHYQNDVWNSADGKLDSEMPKLPATGGSYLNMDWVGTTETVAALEVHGGIHLWTRGQKLDRTSLLAGGLNGAVSPDGKLVARTDGTDAVAIGDLATGMPIVTIPGIGYPEVVLSARFSPGGRHLITGALESARIWSLEKLTLAGSAANNAGAGTGAFSFSPDGTRVAFFANAKMFVGDGVSGKPFAEIAQCEQ